MKHHIHERVLATARRAYPDELSSTGDPLTFGDASSVRLASSMAYPQEWRVPLFWGDVRTAEVSVSVSEDGDCNARSIIPQV